MVEQKGPHCGFLGLGSSSRASGNIFDVVKNGGGRDFDLVLKRNADRHEIVDVASDRSPPDAEGIAAVNDFPGVKSKRLSGNRTKRPARRGWSQETWAGIRLEVTPAEPFAFLFPKTTRNTAKKTVNRDCTFPEYLKPYTRSELLEIIGMFPEAPPSAYEIKSTHESRMDIAASRFKCEKDPTRLAKGGPSMVIDENYLYSLVLQPKLGGSQKIDRTNTLDSLEKLLVRIADGNLENSELYALNRELSEDVAAEKLRYEQMIRSADGFDELTFLIKVYYDKVYKKAVRARKHEEDELYYHPEDRLARGATEESVHRQLSTFTEVNVNSWAENDLQDPTIVRSNRGLRILDNSNPDLSFDERKVLEFRRAAPLADQPSFQGEEEARQCMAKQETVLKKNNEDWEIYLKSQIAALGEEYLTGDEIAIALDGKFSKILFQFKEDPEEATFAFLHEKGEQNIKPNEFECVLQTIQVHLEEERRTIGSLYWKLLHFKQDLVLRKLRLEIVTKINTSKYYFVLQNIPPVKMKPRMTHCAYPYCNHHKFDLMPAEGYRLVLMSAEHHCEPEWKFDDVRESTRTPGRGNNGEMLFCLSCVEKLFNGDGLIRTELSAPDQQHPPHLDEGAPPQAPSIKPALMAPGLDIFAATLHTFIKPEMRYSSHEFYTLNSFEYQALMKWKNMCIRKTMWEIPSNRTFNLQIPGQAADYDLVNLFGDDVLDVGEPRPSIVLGIPLNMEEVVVDDISTLKYQRSSRPDDVEMARGCKRKYPLSHAMKADDIDTPEPGWSVGENIVELLNGSRCRVVKPLSEIMKLIDRRVQVAWGAMIPPYVPCTSREVPAPLHREWPPHCFWNLTFRKESEELKKAKQHKVIKRNYKIIKRTLEARGFEDLIKCRQQEANTRDWGLNPARNTGSPNTCVTCGVTTSPEWRNGPGENDKLCNACGIRYFRNRKNGLVHFAKKEKGVS